MNDKGKEQRIREKGRRKYEIKGDRNMKRMATK